jgi:hypothetical protein
MVAEMEQRCRVESTDMQKEASASELGLHDQQPCYLLRQ